MRANLRPTDGPDAGKALRLEPWQRGLLDAIDCERKPIVAVRAASQIGKTVLALGVGLRAAVDGAGTLLASATGESVKDLRRRLDRSLDLSPAVGEHFVTAHRRGPGAATWNDRKTVAGGWVQLAAAGSPSQLASRTARVAIADEVARWPRQVRSGEGHPLALLRMRLADWGEDDRLLAISSPTLAHDAIGLLFRDGDRRRLEYRCPACGERFPFLWEQVTGREKGEQPSIACSACGASHDEDARRKMLRSAKWVAQRDDATDEDVISFTLGRLDLARSSLGQVVREWRRARRGAERGDPAAIADTSATAIVTPADAPSLATSPECTCRCTSLFRWKAGSRPYRPALARSHDSAVRADSRMTSPWRPVRVSAPEPGIRLASTKDSSPPAAVRHKPTATLGVRYDRRPPHRDAPARRTSPRRSPA